MKFPSTNDDSNLLGVKATASTDLKQKWRPQIWLSSGEHRLSRLRPCREVCRVVGCRNVGEHRWSRLSVHSPCAVRQRMAVLCCTVSIPAGHDSLFCRNSIDVSVEGTAMEAKKTLDNFMDLVVLHLDRFRLNVATVLHPRFSVTILGWSWWIPCTQVVYSMTGLNAATS